MKNRRNLIYKIAAIAILLGVAAYLWMGRNSLPDWAIGYFLEQEDASPVVREDASAVFYCPAIDKNVNWEKGGLSHPSATVQNGKVVLLYQAEDETKDKEGRSISRIGYAVSADGLSFQKAKTPVLYPNRDSEVGHEWLGGCEDPRVAVTKDGTYVMFYTQSNRYTSRLAVALSKDLKSWTKYGPIFEEAYNGKYYNISTTSASIVTKVTDDKQVIEKVDGRYYMYWGDSHIYAATSDNLIDWKPIEDENGELEKVLSPRQNSFDSRSVACGPSAILTEKGIVLLYNGKNKEGEMGSQEYSECIVAGGQALFDAKKPDKLIARLNEPFILPKETANSNKKDSIREHKIFIQSLVYFKNQWYLYYGDKNSEISVAIFDPS